MIKIEIVIAVLLDYKLIAFVNAIIYIFQYYQEHIMILTQHHIV